MMPEKVPARPVEKEPLSPEAALEFANRNKFLIPDGARLMARCVDGRYRAVAAEAAPLARAGADVGYLMTALSAVRALGIPVEKEKVLQAVIASAGGIKKFRFHTDEHATHDRAGACMGCGHFKNAARDSDAYELTDEDITFIADSLDELLKGGARQEILSGDHGEQATFIVGSKKFSLKPMGADGVQAFIYHKTLEGERLALLTRFLLPALQKSKPDLAAQELSHALWETSDAQTAETVRRLAANLPLYEVEINDAGAVRFASRAEKAAA